MEVLYDLIQIVIHPRKTSRKIARENSIVSSLTIVCGFGAATSLLFATSYLAHDYPPPPDELDVWIDTWGEFAMLPFVKVTAERYRLILALIMVPLTLAIWILMAGSARILSVLFGGTVSFEQYLNLFGYSFFAFWILAQLLDIGYSILLRAWTLPALRNEYGPIIYGFFAGYPSFVWVGALALGGIYNGIVTDEVEQLRRWQVAVVGLATFAWPTVFISVLLR